MSGLSLFEHVSTSVLLFFRRVNTCEVNSRSLRINTKSRSQTTFLTQFTVVRHGLGLWCGPMFPISTCSNSRERVRLSLFLYKITTDKYAQWFILTSGCGEYRPFLVNYVSLMMSRREEVMADLFLQLRGKFAPDQFSFWRGGGGGVIPVSRIGNVIETVSKKRRHFSVVRACGAPC